jgi:1A family penicillin-binding protein
MKLVHSIKRFFHNLKPLFRKDFYTRKNLVHMLKKYKKKLFYALIGLLLIVVLIPPLTVLYYFRDLSDKERLMNRNKTGLTLVDKDGNEFYSFDKPKEIVYVPLSEIPKSVQDAVIAAEDKEFYTNPGFSIRGMLRAFWVNLQAGEVVQGGSTITQELVKNVLLSSSRNYLRKYQEIFLAYEINRRYSKQEILEMYLNSVYFGEGAFGIENAAQAYFGTSAKNLTTPQSALLIGLLPAPSAYSPLSNDPQRAIKRQHTVLGEMVEEKFITSEEAELLKQEELVYATPVQQEQKTFAIHFAIYVKDLLVKKFGEERVIRDGFKVKTTLNSTWQQYAEQAVNNQVLALRRNNATNGAAIAIDPKTGAIPVMVGSYDWNDEEFGKANMAITPRQPGSAFKPIVYAEGLRQHTITAATLLDDKQKTFYGGYKPQNYDKRYRGPVTVRRSLANSLNIPSVEIMDLVGVDKGLSIAKKLGIKTLGSDASQYGLSLVLGTGEITLIELTNAYGAFANKGIYLEANPILEIRNKYDKDVNYTVSKPKNVLNDGVAFIISSILSDNKARAEVFGSALTTSRPTAVKTGTTENYRDALTVGYTPSLVIGVWVGNNDNKPMDNIAGSLGAAPIWRTLMQTFLSGTPIEPFIKPGSVMELMVCPGKNPGEVGAVASAYKEYFLPGTEPEECVRPTLPPTDKPTGTPRPTPTDRPTPTNRPEPTDIPEPTNILDEDPTEIPEPTIQISLPL